MPSTDWTGLNLCSRLKSQEHRPHHSRSWHFPFRRKTQITEQAKPSLWGIPGGRGCQGPLFIPRLPEPMCCTSRSPFPLGGGIQGCWKVGLSEAERGVPSCPQKAPRQHTSPAHPDPTAATHPRRPCHCHQGIRVCRVLRPKGGRGASTASCVEDPHHGPSGAVGSVCAWQRHTGRLPSTAGPGSPGDPVGGLGWTSDHHRGLVNLPLSVLLASSAPRIPPLGGPLMPGLLCGRGRVLLECVQGT